MATLNKEVIATLVSGSLSEFYTIGNKAFGLESTSVDLATQCYTACPEFYMVTPSKVPTSMYQGLSNGIVDAYSNGVGKDNECYLAKVENNWTYVSKSTFEKHNGHKQAVTNNWLLATDFKKLKSGKLDFGSDDGKAIAGLAQARKDKVVGQVNAVIKRLQTKAKQLFDTTETEPKVTEFNLTKDLEKILTKSEKFDDENPVLLKKLFDDVIAKYNKA
jgi:hypothetical protein